MKKYLWLAVSFFCPCWLGIAKLGLSALGLVNSGGGSGGGQGSAGYAPSGLGSADQMWQSLAATDQNSLNGYGGGLASQINPAFQQSFQQGMGINYNPYLQASQMAGQQYGGLSNMAGQAGQLSMNQGMAGFGQQQNLQGMGNQLWNTAADPLNAQYNQQFQQNQDQANAVNSMYGLGSSGAGAGMTQQADQNFNNQWQQMMLQRQLQGAQGVSQLNNSGIQAGNQGSANIQAGMGYYGQQPGFTQQSAQMPLNAEQYAAQQPGLLGSTYASQVGQGMAPYFAQQGQIVPYLFQGAGATGNAYANQLAGNAQQQQSLQNVGNSLGQVNWGNLSNMFNTNTSAANAANNDQFGSSSGLGGSASAGDYSDRRLKTNVVRVGTHRLGIGVYEYDIFDRREKGVMADEVLSVMPEAVYVGDDGFMRVRYAMLGG